MTGKRAALAATLTAILLSACNAAGTGAGNKLFSSSAEQMLNSGIKTYEEGDYQQALVTLRSAQEAGLDDKADQLRAHKYVAFIHCVSGRENLCRDEFRKALEINPTFELKPEEAGHPVWGPVFRGEKSKLIK